MQRLSIVVAAVLAVAGGVWAEGPARGEIDLAEWPSLERRVRAELTEGAGWDLTMAVRADFDCDGTEDFAAVAEAETAVTLVIILGPVDGGGATYAIVLDVGGRTQASLCALPAHLSVASLDYDPTPDLGPIPGFRQSATCFGFDLRGGECDTFHFFWHHDEQAPTWWRL